MTINKLLIYIESIGYNITIYDIYDNSIYLELGIKCYNDISYINFIYKFKDDLLFIHILDDNNKVIDIISADDFILRLKFKDRKEKINRLKILSIWMMNDEIIDDIISSIKFISLNEDIMLLDDNNKFIDNKSVVDFMIMLKNKKRLGKIRRLKGLIK